MVTTQLDFFHLRTTAGLAQQVRRIARRMRWKKFTKHAQEWEHKFDQAFEKGDIDKVVETYHKLMNINDKKEGYLFLMDKDELRLMNEEQKNIEKEEDWERNIRPFLEKLSQTDKDLYAQFQKNIDIPLKEVCAKVHERMDQIRRILNAMRGDQEAYIKARDAFNAMRSEKGLEWTIGRDARLEKTAVKHQTKAIKKLFDNLNKVNSLVKQNKLTEAESELKKIFKVEKKVFVDMKAEADLIYDAITKITFIYVELLTFIKEKLPAKLKKLEENKFPVAQQEELKKTTGDFFKIVAQHMADIYSLARYEEARAR